MVVGLLWGLLWNGLMRYVAATASQNTHHNLSRKFVLEKTTDVTGFLVLLRILNYSKKIILARDIWLLVLTVRDY